MVFQRLFVSSSNTNPDTHVYLNADSNSDCNLDSDRSPPDPDSYHVADDYTYIYDYPIANSFPHSHCLTHTDSMAHSQRAQCVRRQTIPQRVVGSGYAILHLSAAGVLGFSSAATLSDVVPAFWVGG